MIYGCARVSTDGQSVTAQVAALQDAGAGKVWRETANGAQSYRAQLRKALAALDAGDVLLVTRLDRLARSTRDLLNTLATVTGKGAGFKSLADAWADTTTPHGRLMGDDASGAGGVRARLDPCADERGPQAGAGGGREKGPTAEAHPLPAARGRGSVWPQGKARASMA